MRSCRTRKCSHSRIRVEKDIGCESMQALYHAHSGLCAACACCRYVGDNVGDPSSVLSRRSLNVAIGGPKVCASPTTGECCNYTGACQAVPAVMQLWCTWAAALCMLNELWWLWLQGDCTPVSLRSINPTGMKPTCNYCITYW